jgi:hypothetical protein
LTAGHLLQRVDDGLHEEGHEAELDAVLLHEVVLVFGAQGHDGGHVDLVEGGEHRGLVLGGDEALGDALAQRGHLAPAGARAGITVEDLGQTGAVQRVELLHADDGGVARLIFRAIVAGSSMISWKCARGELGEAGDGGRVAQQRLGRHDDQRLAEVALHLAAQAWKNWRAW